MTVRAANEAVRVEAVLDALPSPTVLVGPDGTVLLANSAWVARNAAAPAAVALGVGGNYFDSALRFLDDTFTRSVVGSLRALADGELDAYATDCAVPDGAGGTRWFHLQASRVDGSGQIVVTHTDITARVHAERTSSWQARHDHLTELPNRAHLHELIDEELRRPGRGPVAVLFLDCDGFKEVNDSLGHEVGDELLRQIAARLSGRTRAGDTVGRLGGDEFVVLCRDCDADGAVALAERFATAFDEPFALGGRTARLTASIGIAATPADDVGSARATDLVRDADLAMYAAKAAGRGRVHTFTSDLRAAAERRALLAGELSDAIAGGQLLLHYQPVMFLPTGECSGVEALVRWQHPERGLLHPGDFLAAAERQDLVVPLARWVLGEAARQTAEWLARGLDLVTGVNISAGHLATGTLLDDVTDALTAAGLDPSRLLVELTETSVAPDPQRAAEQFAILRRSGIEVSIDDFGSGYSSLGQLVNIPAGILKIDRSLVAGAGDRARSSAAAIAAVVGLASALGMRTLAEGVETADQLARVMDLGCTFAQGHHIARPMPAGDLARWMTVWRRAPGAVLS
ncbi:putative bifunctional diguanylate cyclase/phosphodiesterase [Geodermatophilus sp. SYSU D00691]